MNHNGYYENEARKKHLLRKHDIMNSILLKGKHLKIF